MKYRGILLIPFVPLSIIGFLAGMVCVTVYCGWIWAERFIEWCQEAIE